MAVRFEKVIVDLDDRFTRPMAGMAASTALFRRNVEGAGRDLDVFGRNADKNVRSIDQFSGRLRLLADVAAVLGPALAPIGAMAIPAVAGLAAQFGFAAVGAGTAMAAFQGVGTALEAVNKAHLEPTAKNLAEAQKALEAISPAAREMVGQLREMQPLLEGLRDTAAEGMFPGLIVGMEALETALPKVERILSTVSAELGSIAADTGISLASDRWAPFLEFIATDAPPALRDMSSAIGNVAHGMSELWMAFDPLNDDFSSWMVDATRGFDEWAAGLSQTDGFQDFVEYLRSSGPQVADTLGALGNAILQIVEAAAPIGGPVLAGIEAFANAVAAIADSDLGTPIFGMVAAMSALNLAMRTASSLSLTAFGGPALAAMRKQGGALRGLQADWAAYNAVQRTAAGRAQASAAQMMAHREAASRLGSTMRSTVANVGKGAAAIGGLAVATTGVGDKMGFTNTVALGLMGTLAGPWGAAVGAGAGLMLDMASAGNDVADALTRIDTAAKAGNISKATSELAALEARQRDVNDVSGIGDFFSDIGKSGGASLLQGLGRIEVDGIDEARRKVANLRAELANQAEVRTAADAAQFLGTRYELTGVGAREAGRGVDAFKASVEGLTAGLTRQDKLDSFRSSLLDFRDSLQDNGKTLASNTRAGLANRAALRSIAASAIDAASSMQNFGRRTRFLDRARGDFIKAATAAGMTRREARQLATQLGLVDRLKVRPKFTTPGATEAQQRIKKLREEIRVLKGKSVHMDEKGAAAARARIAALRAEIDRLQGKTIDITTRRTTIFTTKRSGLTYGKGDNFADGGLVSGPGGPRDDAIPAWLSNGEFVVNAAATQRYRAELEAMNAQKFASGGLVSPRVSVSAPAVSMAGALAGAQFMVDMGDMGVAMGRIVDERIADHADMAGMGSRTRG